MLLPCWFLLFK